MQIAPFHKAKNRFSTFFEYVLPAYHQNTKKAENLHKLVAELDLRKLNSKKPVRQW